VLYDAKGQLIPEADPRPPRAGITALWEDGDHQHLSSAGRALTPEKVDGIMQAADSGDTPRMCALAEQIDDRSFAIGAALDTRRAAIEATPWRIEGADDSSRADDIAKSAQQMLSATRPENDLLTFQQMIKLELGSALLPGFAAPEIVWSAGGAEVLGFSSIPQKHFSFVGTRTPRLLTTDHPEGIELPPGKFVLHWHRAKGGSPVRGGLIRAAAWMRCFEGLGFKDLVRFVERYGMPFLVAGVDEQTWKSERSVLRSIVRNFGPDGGAVLSKNTELQLLQAAGNTGDVYFRLLEYLERAAEKLILGQTGTSSEGGWSNNGAQHMVRMDIRDSDCSQIAESVYARILVPWVRWNYGPEAPLPRMVYDIEEAKDAKAEAEVIKTLGDAGWEMEAEQIEANTGYRVTRRVTRRETPPQAPGSTLAAALQDNDRFRAQAAALADEDDATDIPDTIADAALPQARSAAAAMFAPLQDRLDAIAQIADPAEFARACAALSAELPALAGGDSPETLEAAIRQVVHASAATGISARLNELERKA